MFDTIENYKKQLAANGGKTYFAKQLDNYNSAAFHAKLDAATIAGKTKAAAITKMALDHTAPGHEAARQTYNALGGNLISSCVADAHKAVGVAPVEFQNGAYESKTLSSVDTPDGRTIKLICNTPMDVAIVDKFQALLNASWQVNGYKADAENINDFFLTHKMSQSN